VLLPDPFGPMMPCTAPAGIDSRASTSASTDERDPRRRQPRTSKRLRTLSATMSGAAGLITRTLSPVRSRALRLRAALLVVAAELLLRTRGTSAALRALARAP